MRWNKRTMAILRCKECGTIAQENLQKCAECGAVFSSAISEAIHSSSLADTSNTREIYLSSEPVAGHFITAAISIWLVVFFGRSIVDSIFQRIEADRTVHEDGTEIDSGIWSQTREEVVFVFENNAGELKKVVADKQSFSKFANEHFEYLEEEKGKLKKLIESSIRKTNSKSFSEMSNHIPDYADWYFAYTTTYKILGIALSSASSHAFETSVMPLKDAVAADVEEYLEMHFEEIVLKPELSDSMLKQNYKQVLGQAHTQFLKTIAELKQEFQKYIAERTSHYDDINYDRVSIKIDWERQFEKVSMTGYEKGGGGAAVGAGLTGGGAVAGKLIAGKVVASGIGKAFLAKLAAPFVGKAVSLAGSVAAGGAAGRPSR